ncbi:serine/threonine protein kinase [Magnaporthiopsis poae ATCC 64411]|uniref:Serine/threonine protein kinase n=1 Tax=Magnaporthiopsis poae (strain ATCC 64411 / 73-15) TaxID=644358 RepID=A0A0C4DN05_MAGP6|nr:serine/threonine protein kinase [Magnaporthiopsis poae ATCC 64411]
MHSYPRSPEAHSTASSAPDGDRLDDGDELDNNDEDWAFPEPDDPMGLEDLLHCYGVSHADENVQWPYAKLRRVVTRERVLRALQEECGFDEADAQNYCSRIMPASDDADTETLAADSVRWRKPGELHMSQRAGYLRVFATLMMQSKGNLVRYFIEQGVSDRELPLETPAPTVGPARRGKGGVGLVLPEEPVPRPRGCFRRHELNMFVSTQWRFVLPYFAPSISGDAAHYDLPPDAILPWVAIKSGSAGQPTLKEEQETGGYGILKRVRIHPDCHSLGTLLGSSSLPDRFFAIKSIRRKYLAEYTNEVEFLKRFSGTGHSHLVPLLSTFTHLGSYHFIFPWAEGDLDQWWSRSIGPPPRTFEFRRWIARQISGLVDAMYTIHEPKQGASNLSPDEKRFGHHGNLKPQNVLWFASSKDSMGILMIADFGIAVDYGEISNVPYEHLPRTPAYRPPECDMDGGKIARAFDIWSMGCIFLEMAAWLLGGAKGRAAFKRERQALYLAMSLTDIYFDIQEMLSADGITGGSGKYVFLVKESVTKVCATLFRHNIPTLLRQTLTANGYTDQNIWRSCTPTQPAPTTCTN